MGRNAKRKKEERQKGRRPNRRRRKWVTRALLSLAIIAAIVAWQWKGPLWGYKTAPSFSLDASTGQLVSLRDYLGKQEIVIIFYMGAS